MGVQTGGHGSRLRIRARKIFGIKAGLIMAVVIAPWLCHLPSPCFALNDLAVAVLPSEQAKLSRSANGQLCHQRPRRAQSFSGDADTARKLGSEGFTASGIQDQGHGTVRAEPMSAAVISDSSDTDNRQGQACKSLYLFNPVSSELFVSHQRPRRAQSYSGDADTVSFVRSRSPVTMKSHVGGSLV